MSPPPSSSASTGQRELNSNTDTSESSETMNPNASESNESVTNASTSSTGAKSRRYPSRHRKPPNRL